MSDRLVARWKSGDFDAFVELARPHFPSIRAMAAYHSPQGTALWDCDDIAQEAFLEAYESLAAFDASKGEFLQWLKGIARNKIRRAWQEAARETKRLEKISAATTRFYTDEHTRNLDADPVLEALRGCLKKLPPTSEKLVHAHYSEGLPIADIAERLGRKTNAVYVELHRLRRALRKCVEGTLGQELDSESHV